MNTSAHMSDADPHDSVELKVAETPGSAASIEHGKRRRALVACSSCRRKKIRCNSARPRCENCARGGLDCNYPVETRRKRTKAVERDELTDSANIQLCNRLERVETMLSLLLDRQGVAYKSSDHTAGSLSPDESSDLDDSEDFSQEQEYESGDKFGGEDSLVEGTAADIFKLSERRAPVIVKLGDTEPLIAYAYGFMPSMLSPKGMRVLCECIGNHALGELAEKVLSRLWKQKTGALLESGKLLTHHEALVPELISSGMRLFNDSTSEIIHALIDKNDIKFINKLCCPSGDFSKIEYTSPYSLLYPTLVMTCTNPSTSGGLSDAFSSDLIKSQNSVAFSLCLSRVAGLSWAPTTFLLLRLLALTTLSLSQKILFPQLRGTVSMCIYMAINLGLHRSDGGRKLSPEERNRRALVWAIIQDIDTKIAAAISNAPLIVQYNQTMTSKQLSSRPGSDLHHLGVSMDLSNIYLRVHCKLFSPRAQKLNVNKLMANLLALDNQLIEWKKALPQFTQDTQLFSNLKHNVDSGKTDMDQNSLQILLSFEKSLKVGGLTREKISIWSHLCTMVCYYNILILIHSIPAFTPSCLRVYKGGEVPPRLLDSLSIISDSARNILKMTFNMKMVQSDSFIAFTATHAFSALFLKQIRDPRHPSNAEDLLLIYRYITKFKENTELMDEADSIGTMNLWLIFAQALTQLNREYPTGTPEVRAQLVAEEKLHCSGYQNVSSDVDLRCSKPTQQSPEEPAASNVHLASLTPALDMAQVPIYNQMNPGFDSAKQQYQHQHQQQQHQQQQQQQQQQQLQQEQQQPMPLQYPPRMVQGQIFNPQFARPMTAQMPSVYYPPSPVNSEIAIPSSLHPMMPHLPGPPSSIQEQPFPHRIPDLQDSRGLIEQHQDADRHSSDQPYSTHATNQSTPGGLEMPLDEGHVDHFDTRRPHLTPGYESALWDAFRETQGIDVAFNDDDIMNGLDHSDFAALELPPNNCIIS